jgi:hypothetical protein
MAIAHERIVSSLLVTQVERGYYRRTLSFATCIARSDLLKGTGVLVKCF